MVAAGGGLMLAIWHASSCGLPHLVFSKATMAVSLSNTATLAVALSNAVVAQHRRV